MTEDNKIQEAEQDITEENNFKIGDIFVWKNTTYKVVEILELGPLHIKNVNEPFNSIIVTKDDLEDKGE